jgi:hypothetical protein
VRPGEDHRGVNFGLRPVPTARIEGRVVGPNGRVANQQLRLLPENSEDFGAGTETAATVSAPDGSFAFLRVPSGRYTIGAGRQVGAPGAATLVMVDKRPNGPRSGAMLVGVDAADVDSVTSAWAEHHRARRRRVRRLNDTRPVQGQLADRGVAQLASGRAGAAPRRASRSVRQVHRARAQAR